MSRIMDMRRARRLALAGGLALASLLAAVGMTWLDIRQAWTPDVSGPVLPDWGVSVASAREIRIDSGADRFVLERQDDGWVMPSRDGYPVRDDRLAELDAFLAALDYVGARTADPDKHARLGLASGNGEGSATRVTVRDETGEVTADILLGRQAEDIVYVRFPGRNRTYAARSGETTPAMPDIAEAQDWLELDFLELGGNDIALATIQPETGPAYRLERASPSIRNFALRDPAGWRPITAAAGNGPANALARVRFRDVRAASRLGGEVVARHVAETFGGLQVELDVRALAETRWATVRVRALTDDAEDAAATLGERVNGWAYLVSDLTLDRMIRPLDQIADPRPEPADAP